ncbi:unnamed protein product, partial [Linum tenue]
AELRASVFEAIKEEDRVVENEEGLPPALLGSCNDRAKQLHASPSGYYLGFIDCLGRGSGRRVPENESLSNLDSRNMRRPSSSSVAGGLPPLGRC